MNQELSKEIMHRPRLRNNLLRNRSDENILSNKLLCLIIKKAKRTYYSTLNEKKTKENKTFSKIVKPFLSDRNS